MAPVNAARSPGCPWAASVPWPTPRAIPVFFGPPRRTPACCTLEDAQFYLNLFSAHTDDPLAIWGDPATQRRFWAAHDPTELAARLRGTRLFVSSGNGEPGPFDRSGQLEDRVEATVYREGRAFAERLRGQHIPVTTDFYGPGMHDWPYWERELERSLPVLMEALGASR